MKYARIVAEFYSRAWALRIETLNAMQQLIREHAYDGVRLSAEEIRERIETANAASGYVPIERGGARFVCFDQELEMEAANGKRNSAAAGSVAVIPIVGVVSHRMNMMGDLSGSGGASIQKLTAQFRQAMEDGNCKAIIFDVDSPGGSVEGVVELANEIYAARKQKEIIAVCNSMACSAAYWLASAAGELVCTESGQCGSIGVYMVHQDESAALEKEGIKITIIKAGKFKAEGAPSEPLSEEALKAFQSKVDDYYGMFIKAVARNRGTSQAAVREGYGQGRSLLAGEAVKQKLADRVGTLDEVLGKFGAKSGSSVSARAENRPASANEFADKACVQCGKRATNAAADFQEVAPENGFTCWEPTGVHYGCDLHVQASKSVRLSGNAEYTKDLGCVCGAKTPEDDEPDEEAKCKCKCLECAAGNHAQCSDEMCADPNCGHVPHTQKAFSPSLAARRRQIQLLRS